MSFLFRRNRPALDETLVDIHRRLVQSMLETRRKGNNPGRSLSLYNGPGIRYEMWQILERSALAESLKLFDAECKAYATRLQQLPVPADETPRPPADAGVGVIPAHLLARSAAARAKADAPRSDGTDGSWLGD